MSKFIMNLIITLVICIISFYFTDNIKDWIIGYITGITILTVHLTINKKDENT